MTISRTRAPASASDTPALAVGPSRRHGRGGWTERVSPILLLIVATTLIRLAFAASTGLGIDESYMIASGRDFAPGYFDHPPVSWWLSHGAAALFGSEAPVAIRLPFILLFAASQWLVWRIADGGRAGFWAAVALNLSPVFGVTSGTWVLPDGPLDAALLAAVFCLIQALRSDRGAWWVGTGCAAGLALLSKYSAILVMGGAVLYLLTQERRRLATPGPWIALLLAAAIFSPVVIWNAANGWASFAFQGDRALGLQFHPFAPLAVLGGEALFVLPWFWLAMMLLLIRAFAAGAPWRDRLLAWLAVPPIVAFAVVSLWSRERILYHWAAPGYLMLFPLLGAAIADRIDQAWVKRTIAATAALVLISLVVIATEFDWIGATLASVIGKDPTAEGTNWVTLRQDLQARGLLHPGQLVAAFNWRDAGKIGYALGPDVRVLCLCSDPREFGVASPPSRYAGQDALIVSVGFAPEPELWFESVAPLAPSTVRANGRVLMTIIMLHGRGLRAVPRPHPRPPMP